MTPGRAAFRQLFVVACLFLLVRHAGWIAQQEEFRAEESHAFRPHLLDAGVFMGEFTLTERRMLRPSLVMVGRSRSASSAL